jgi:hypothetical protein
MIKSGVCFLVLIIVLDSPAGAAKAIYQRGSLIKVSPKYTESPAPMPPAILPPPQILVGYSFEIQVGTFTYFVDAALCCPLRSKYKLEWAANDPIDFRWDKDRMFIRRQNGKELNARLRKVIQTNANNSSSPPHHVSAPQFQPFVGTANRGKTIPLGIDFLRADDMCLLLDADVGADDFFDDLRERNTANGIEFRKGTHVVKTFPGRLTVRVIAELGTCTLAERNPEGGNTRNVTLDEHFMRSLTFEGAWKQGFDEKTADLGPLAEGRIPNPTPLPSYRDWWEYDFEVSSYGISLNDALIIVIQSPDGRMIARFSTRLPNGLK